MYPGEIGGVVVNGNGLLGTELFVVVREGAGPFLGVVFGSGASILLQLLKEY